MKTLAAILLLTVTVTAQAPSQPPTPAPPEQRQVPQQQAGGRSGAANEQNAGPSQNVVVTVNQQSPNPQRDTPNRPPQDQQDGTPGNWWETVFGGIQASAALAMIALTVGLVVVAVQQRRTADTQARILKETLAANKIIERAYVDISHKDGITLVADVPPPIQFTIKNHGRTPADILATTITLIWRNRGDALPDRPPYGTDEEVTTALLMPAATIELSGALKGYRAELVEAFQQGRATLWVIGYVDYMDRFGQRHRGGYARRYDPTRIGNNLVFETKPGYNYDIEIDEQGNPKNKA